MHAQGYESLFSDTFAQSSYARGSPPGDGESKGNKSTAQRKIETAYGQLPLVFESNEGQSDSRVKFLCRGVGYGLFLTGSDTVLALTRPEAKKPAPIDVLCFKLVGAKGERAVEGADPLPGRSNYIIGSDPKKWRINVPEYARVRSAQVYPGIDLVYYGRQRQLEYDFNVAPGADPRAIRFRIQGAGNTTLNNHGDLVLQTSGGDVIEKAPIVYQEVDGRRQTIGGGYQLHYVDAGSGAADPVEVSFRVAAYDHSRPLVIDPVLAYSTYLGGDEGDSADAIAVDGAGNAYITGYADSPNFPVTAGAFQATIGATGALNAFVTKLNATGTALVYSTYVGGSLRDAANAIAVDGSGSACITGYTSSLNFPTTAGAAQPFISGTLENAFVTKLNATGTGLVYSTYLGGGNGYYGGDYGQGIAVDGSGNIYIAGNTSSSNFPTTQGGYQPAAGDVPYTDQAFVTELNPALSGSASLVYSTYFGGNSNATARGLALDSSSNAYITGYGGYDLPTTPGAVPPSSGFNAYGAYVAKLNPALSGSASLVYCTYLANNGGQGSAIAVDSAGNAYVTGYTYGTGELQATSGAFQVELSGSEANAFVTKLNASGTALVYSTYLGGNTYDYGNGIAVDSSGNAYVTGFTESTNFPTTTGAFQSRLSGVEGGFLTVLNSTGAALLYSTYLSGNSADDGYGVTVDGANNVYVTGYTSSTVFPTTPGAFQTSLNGGSNAFAACFSFGSGIGSGGPPPSYSVIESAGPNGTISPGTVQTISSGGNVNYVANPDAGYIVGQWLVDGTTAQAGGSNFTLSDINANSTVEAQFVHVTPYPASYQGLLVDGSSYVAIRLTGDGNFTGDVIVGGVPFSFGGQFDSAGYYQGTSSKGAMPISMQLGGSPSGSPSSYIISGSANGTAFSAFRPAYTKGQTAIEAGYYTIALDTYGYPVFGDGYATLKVGKTGAAIMEGKLPDGTSFENSGVIIGGTNGNQFLVYRPLNYPFMIPHQAKGSLVGTISIYGAPQGYVNGSLTWNKPQQSRGANQPAFSSYPDLFGTYYAPPKKGTSVLPYFTTGQVQFSDGDVTLEQPLTLDSANVFKFTSPDSYNIKIAITPSTGLFRGTFAYPGQRRATAFTGVLLQSYDEGFGFFLGPNGSGSVYISETFGTLLRDLRDRTLGAVSRGALESFGRDARIALTNTEAGGALVNQLLTGGASADTAGAPRVSRKVAETASAPHASKKVAASESAPSPLETQQPQTITFPPIATRSVNDSAFVLSATSSSGLPVSFMVVSGSAQIDEATGTILTITGTGVVVIEADQSGSPAYMPAPSAFQSFRVIGSTPIFEALPDVSGAPPGSATDGYAVDNGGLYAAGDGLGNSGTTAILWDYQPSPTDFNPSGPPGDDSAYALSGDPTGGGLFVAGRKLAGGLYNAFVGYDAFDGGATDFTLLPPLAGDDSGEAHGMSPDGQEVVGFAYSSGLGIASSQAVEWVSGSATALTSATGSKAYGVSADGQIVVGAALHPVLGDTVTTAGLLVNSGFKALFLESSNPAKISGTAYAVAGTGENYTVVGSSAFTKASGQLRLAPFRSINGGQPVDLGQLDPTDNAGEALSICADGTYIVGYGTIGKQQLASIWDAQHGIRTLTQALQQDYGVGADFTAGCTLVSANGISPDGFAITGNGIDSEGNPQAWRITVPRPCTLSVVTPAPVDEGALEVSVTVTKSTGLGTDVNYQIVPGTAVQEVDAVGDYDASQLSGQLHFDTPDTSGTITIPLNQNLAKAVGGSRSFSVVLTSASNGAIISSSSGTAVVTIMASQTTDPNGPPTDLQQTQPVAQSQTGALQVILQEPNSTGTYSTRVAGQVPGWRFAGESTWRSSGDIVDNLSAPGSFPIEFESLVNLSGTSNVKQPAPAQAEAAVVAGTTTTLTYQYPASDLTQTGTLDVVISPPEVADAMGQRGQWRFESDSIWYDSGAVIPNLPAGSYLLDFSTVPGHAQIPTFNVEVTAGDVTTVQALYQDEELVTGTLPQPLNPAAVTGSSPYDFVGQISTDIGTGSGVVVANRVVLTAAHVIFDDATDNYANGVQWRFERIAGQLEPAPLVPLGAYVLSGYSADRVGATEEVGTPASQEQDAAVLFFSVSAGNGGSSGCLVSGTANQWLLRARQKVLAGYPEDTSYPGVMPGQMQATPPLVANFIQTGTNVFETTQIAGLSGMSGGPLCVQYDDGLFYPAGIYLGGNQQCVVRSIDSTVEEMIESGINSSENVGQNNANTGAVFVSSDVIDSEFQTASITVNFEAGSPSGAAWRFTTDPNGVFINKGGDKVIVATNDTYTIQFAPVSGYVAPADYGPFRLQSGENRKLEAGYGNASSPVITSSALPIAGIGLPYSGRIEATNGPTNFLVTQITDPSGTLLQTYDLNEDFGLMLAKNGKLSGMVHLNSAEPPGTYVLYVTAQNAAGTSGVRQLDLTVAQAGALTVSFDPTQGSVTMGTEKLKPMDMMQFPVGQSVTLTAIPDSPGYIFGEWTGTGTPNVPNPDRTLQFTMSSSVSITGSFALSPFIGANGANGAYNGLLVSDTDTGAGRGYFTAQVSPARACTMAFNVGAERYGLKDTFSDGGSLLHTINGTHGSASATVNLQLGFSGTDAMTGTVTVGGTTFALSGYKTGFAVGKQAATKYTLVLPHVTGTGLPGGDGFGTLTVTAGGGVSFSGTLGDETPVSERSMLDQNGDWPFFALLYHKQGVITGWLNLSPASAPAITGTLEWFKPQNHYDPLYPDGFTLSVTDSNTISVEGDALDPMATLSPVTLNITGGGLSPEPRPISVQFNAHGVGTATGVPGFTLKVNTDTGLFNGQFPNQGMTYKFNGVLLDPLLQSNPPSGFGAFPGAALQTGAVELSQ